MVTINSLYKQYIELPVDQRAKFLSDLNERDSLLVSLILLPGHQEPRSQEYPSIVVQLDALWHDLNSGVIPGKENSKFYAMIKSIKDKYPKPIL